MMQDTAAGRRPYRSPRRVEQAAQTRAAVLAAAGSLFSQRGWAATGMRDVAAEAGVAVETVYANYRSKAELLMAAIDVTVVGDAEPVPLAERPEFAELAAGTFGDRVAAAARLVTQIHQRTAGLHLALRQGAASEPELARRLMEGEDRRRLNTQQGAELIGGRPHRFRGRGRPVGGAQRRRLPPTHRSVGLVGGPLPGMGSPRDSPASGCSGQVARTRQRRWRMAEVQKTQLRRRRRPRVSGRGVAGGGGCDAYRRVEP